jgi:hypothetical protein
MQPFKLKFIYDFTATEREFDKYDGIKKINEITVQEITNARGGNYISSLYHMLSQYKEEISDLFVKDIKSAVKFETADFNIDKIKSGRTPVPYTNESFEYEAKIKMTSAIYTCVQITDNKQFVCYTDENKELIFIQLTSLFKAVYL